jgi:hypothetical protein
VPRLGKDFGCILGDADDAQPTLGYQFRKPAPMKTKRDDPYLARSTPNQIQVAPRFNTGIRLCVKSAKGNLG